MKQIMKRMFGFALSLALVAGMLPVSVFATDCEHTELIKGVCQNEACKKEFVAAVGETLYEELNAAVMAANTSDPGLAVVLLTDLNLNGQAVALGGAYLAVNSDEELTVENGTLKGTHAQQVLYNDGKLVLKNLTVENEAGMYAVFSENVENKAEASLRVFGGSYIGKEYGIGLKDMQMQLNSYTAEGSEELPVIPAVDGTVADFRLEDSAIELLCALGEETSYTVDRTTPGLFAFTTEYASETTVSEDWFRSIHGENTYNAAERKWERSGSVETAATISPTEFTYTGMQQTPTVSVNLNGETLTVEEDYTVSYTKDGESVEEVINVGKYKVKVSGKEPYSGTHEIEFEIKAATPVLSWSAESEQLDYTGQAAVLTSKVNVQLLNDETFNGEITYAYRKGSSGEFTEGLPVDAGTYEVKASVAAFGNYAAGETEQLLTLTIGQKTDAQATLEIVTPDGGYVYTGSAVIPEVVVKIGETVVSAEQYEVSYENNINAGTATVTVKAKADGNYVFEDLKETFEIKKASAAALTIGGQPAKVTYGDQGFQLSVSDGKAVTWSVTEGGSIAAISADGVVTVSGVGKVTVKAERSGDANYNGQSAEYSFEVKPAVLTVESVAAENKTYDGNKTVTIKSVVVKGICNNDDVSVAVNGLKGEVADTKAAVYDAVKLSQLTLTGADAANYILTQPTAAVKTTVTISKATVPSALKDVESTVSVDTANLVIEHLGEGMPADAGEMRYTAKHQDTAKGSKVIVLDWGIDKNGKLTSKLAGGVAGDQIIYEVTVSSDNYKDTTVKIEVTLGSVVLDASKVTVTPANAEMAYDGNEQKPAVEVKYENAVLQAGTDYDVSYPEDTINAGEKELTVQFKGNYSGSATAKYTVTKAKISVSGVQAQNKTYDGTTKAAVTATLSGVVSGDDVKVTAEGAFADKNSGSNKTVNVTYTLSGDDVENYELTAATGTTTAKISPVTSSSLNSRISGLNTGNADSGYKATLQSVVSLANTALQDTGLSSSEKSGLTNVKYNAEDMIGRIESAAAAAATESIRKSADINSNNVKLEDKALLEKAQSDLNSALTSYSGNYTKAEETEIQNKKERIAEALNVITRVQSAQMLIDALPGEITEETVVNAALKTSVEDAQTAFTALNDYEKSLLGEDVQLKLTTVAQAVDGVQPEDDAAKDEAMNQITASPEKGEGFKFPTWILVVAVIAAAACGGGLFLYKRKQEEEELNW